MIEKAMEAQVHELMELRRMREELTEQYEAKYGQLTVYGGNAVGSWHWVTEPFPWEL